MKRKGFTLMEMIISLALVGLVLVLLTPFLSNSFRALNIVSDKSKYQTVTTVALDYMKNVLAQATEVELLDSNVSSAEGSIYCSLDGDFYIVYGSAMEYGISSRSIDGNTVAVSFVGSGRNLDITIRIMNGATEVYAASTGIALTGLYNFDAVDPENSGDGSIIAPDNTTSYNCLYFRRP